MDKPFSIAFLAKRPAPIMTLGFDVLVQLVIAAINISPSFITPVVFSVFLRLLISFSEIFFTSDNSTLSWGLLGPDKQACTLLISKDRVSVYFIF